MIARQVPKALKYFDLGFHKFNIYLGILIALVRAAECQGLDDEPLSIF